MHRPTFPFALFFAALSALLIVMVKSGHVDGVTSLLFVVAAAAAYYYYSKS